MKKKLLASAVLVCALTLGACSSDTAKEDKKDTAPEEKTEAKSEDKKEAASTDKEASSKGILYKVEKGGNTVHLFGSIHVGSEDIYPLHENVERAFDEADHLAVEIDLTALDETEMMTIMIESGIYQDGRSLSDAVEEDTFQDVVDIFAAYGMDESDVETFKPWFASYMINPFMFQKAGYSAEEGIDLYFLNRAGEENLNIIDLEKPEDQMSVLSDILSEDSQAASLEDTVNEYHNGGEKLRNLMDIWQAGDIEAFSKLRSEFMNEMDSEDYQAFAKAFTDDRDEEMTNKIEEFLSADKDETYFVVVGAMHLAGENSIVDLLKDRGYDVQEGI
ncbi:TraB/GumN family protein [Bacillus sp. FSL W7-1360]